MSNSVVRYSDAELAEFKTVIENKLVKTRESVESLQSQILEITENTSDEHGGDWVDDSSINSEVEMLNNMAIRQRRYLKDLENALIRIRNKSYGICVVTGELIDRKRLMAVPTTTKSLAAKTGSINALSPKIKPKPKPKPKPKAGRNNPGKKIISKVIRKPTGNVSKPIISDDDDDDDLEFNKDLLFKEGQSIKPPIDELEDVIDDEDKDFTRDSDDVFIGRFRDDDDDDDE